MGARAHERRLSGRARWGGRLRSWLLIKHRDDWSGDLDITEFAPNSVKSEGGFEDILAEDNPAIWRSNRPAKGGDAGALFAKIIERAAELKAGRHATSAQPEVRRAATKPRRLARQKPAKSKQTKKPR